MWCLPKRGSGEFVWRMEDILSVYQRPFDPDHPLVCLDEGRKQLVGEVRGPWPAGPGRPERYDAEYVRRGVASLFLAIEPLTGRIDVEARERQTAHDFAHVLRRLADEVYPDAERIVLVLDNLVTHSPSALYQAFAPDEARRITERLEIHYTPKHGSWLNIAEIGLSILSRQCLRRRIPDMASLEKEVDVWQERHNANLAPVDWRFTTEDARVKLKRLYPSTLS